MGGGESLSQVDEGGKSAAGWEPWEGERHQGRTAGKEGD